jgi:hypothetical protein
MKDQGERTRMGQIFQLPKPVGKKPNILHFSRAELSKLLHVYSRQVAGGAWRDYAIDHRPGLAMFSIYRSTHETPLFSVVKYAPGTQKRGDYLVLHGQQILNHTMSLDEALKTIEKRASKVISLFQKN